MSLRQWPRRTAGGAAVGALTLAALGAGLAGAQTPEPISVDPGGGPPGTGLTVSGGGCTGIVNLVLLHGDDTLDLGDAVPGVDGDWSGGLVVPEDEGLRGETLSVTADCIGVGPDEGYASGSFTVDPAEEPPPTEPPPTQPPPTEPPPTSRPGAPGGGQSPGVPESPAVPSDGVTTTTTASSGTPTPPPMPPATPVAAQPAQVG